MPECQLNNAGQIEHTLQFWRYMGVYDFCQMHKISSFAGGTQLQEKAVSLKNCIAKNRVVDSDGMQARLHHNPVLMHAISLSSFCKFLISELGHTTTLVKVPW